MNTGFGNPVDPEECRMTQVLFASCSGVKRAGTEGALESLIPPSPQSGNLFSATNPTSIPSSFSKACASRAAASYLVPYIRCVAFVCLHRWATAATELLMESRRAQRPSLASAISRRDSSTAVEVRTAITCSGGTSLAGHGRGRSSEE